METWQRGFGLEATMSMNDSSDDWRERRGVQSIMKKTRSNPEMLEEYDFSKGVRGKYAKKYSEGANVVVIDPDVAKYFPRPRIGQ